MEYKKYWNERYSAGQTSGSGSYGAQLAEKLEHVATLKDKGIKSVLEVGCGDFNFGKHVMFTLKLPMEAYTGIDVSPFVVERNRQYYPKCKFEVAGPDLVLPEPSADLLMCVDVLFHITDDKDWVQILDDLDEAWRMPETKYFVVTAYEHEQEKETSPHVKIRPFPYKRYGTPILREIIKDDGELYFYIFAK